MKVKLDENLPAELLTHSLSALKHDVDTVPQEGLKGQPDEKIWEAAQAAGRFLITQDMRFSDARVYKPGTHHGLLLIRLHEPGRLALTERITGLFQTEDVTRWTGCLVVATDHKVRIRGPDDFESWVRHTGHSRSRWLKDNP